MHPRVRRNRSAWEVAANKYVEETDVLLQVAMTSSSLLAAERVLLGDVLCAGDLVVHLQSGHGLDDLDFAREGASLVLGVDFSTVTTGAAQRRAAELGLNVRYIVADCLRAGVRTGSADLVYTGKGALMWLPDIRAWAREVARLLRPGGHLLVYEAHPIACLWTRDSGQARLDQDRTYFAHTRVNDTFPASAIRRFAQSADVDAVEWQWTISDILNATIAAGLQIERLDEYPEPFWQPGESNVAAWKGRLPNAFSLLAQLPGAG